MTGLSTRSKRENPSLASAIFDVALGVAAGTLIAFLSAAVSGGEIEWQGLALACVFSALIAIAARRHGWSVTEYLRDLRGREEPRDVRDVDSRRGSTS